MHSSWMYVFIFVKCLCYSCQRTLFLVVCQRKKFCCCHNCACTISSTSSSLFKLEGKIKGGLKKVDACVTNRKSDRT